MRLVHEINNVDAREFWWDSDLLHRAARVRDARVIRALALRHHGLSNKEAFSAHVVRNAIKTIDAPDFSLSWSIIDAERDAAQVVHRLEDSLTRRGRLASLLARLAVVGLCAGLLSGHLS